MQELVPLHTIKKFIDRYKFPDPRDFDTESYLRILSIFDLLRVNRLVNIYQLYSDRRLLLESIDVVFPFVMQRPKLYQLFDTITQSVKKLDRHFKILFSRLAINYCLPRYFVKVRHWINALWNTFNKMCNQELKLKLAYYQR